jgi:hypothetical protein
MSYRPKIVSLFPQPVCRREAFLRRTTKPCFILSSWIGNTDDVIRQIP